MKFWIIFTISSHEMLDKIEFFFFFWVQVYVMNLWINLILKIWNTVLCECGGLFSANSRTILMFFHQLFFLFPFLDTCAVLLLYFYYTTCFNILKEFLSLFNHFDLHICLQTKIFAWYIFSLPELTLNLRKKNFNL